MKKIINAINQMNTWEKLFWLSATIQLLVFAVGIGYIAYYNKPFDISTVPSGDLIELYQAKSKYLYNARLKISDIVATIVYTSLLPLLGLFISHRKVKDIKGLEKYQ